MRPLLLFFGLMLLIMMQGCGRASSRRAAIGDGCEPPAWFANPPAGEGLTVAMGCGRHSDRRRAERMALMEANSAMAALIPIGLADSIDFDVRVVQQEVLMGRGEYCAFVMLQMSLVDK
ncbi:MAG: hypothetical protein IKI28_06540 [Bacteroidales bacterium]|nr:hypothetical protein [Bacteroidales bacterium]